jgi:hypothetical protein
MKLKHSEIIKLSTKYELIQKFTKNIMNLMQYLCVVSGFHDDFVYFRGISGVPEIKRVLTGRRNERR